MTTDPAFVPIVGYTAAVLTTSSFIPQAVMTLRTRDVSGISAVMYSAFVVGVALWLVYGILLGDAAIIGANAVALLLAGTILTVKLQELRRAAVAARTGAAEAATAQNEKRTPAE